MIEGLSHITFMVRDLDRMEKILTSVLDAKKVYDSGDQTFSVSREKFFLVPIARYRIIQNGNSYSFLGKYPLRSFDMWHLAISAALIGLVILYNQ